MPSQPVLGRASLSLTLSLLVFLLVCLAFSWTTREVTAGKSVGGREGTPGFDNRQKPHVDLHSWQTAQALADLAVTVAEVEYAREAERLADHDLDQAFASALRQAGTRQFSLTGPALILSQKLTRFQQVVKDDQARLQNLTLASNRSASSATNRAMPLTAADDLDLAKAQLGLDSDELADAQRDLARAVGDDRSNIQQELAAHESAMRKYDTQAANAAQVAAASAHPLDTLTRRLKAWADQRVRYRLVEQAMQEAQADALALTAQHNQLDNHADTSSNPALDKAAKLAALRSQAARSQLLSIYDDRIQSQQQLAALYGKWSAQLLLQHRTMLHLLLQSFALIAFILICVISSDTLVRHLVDRPALDRRRMQTLRILFKVGIQLIGILLILLVLFGAPSQMPTILGLTTAGLTVVLQDFIIAFFGWFVLMGKNGMRLGDWVEINGVGGEVVEVGLFRTALLETGNWTDKGHPTGRRVTFINSFAIKGQYFNFSTAGQWMWDEITLSIPAGDDPYSTIDLISNAVLKETEKDARLAEAEWKRVARQNGVGHFTAAPAVDMRPGASGIDIIVRYVTRASDRFEVRNRLYQCVIGLLHKPLAAQANRDQLQPA